MGVVDISNFLNTFFSLDEELINIDFFRFCLPKQVEGKKGDKSSKNAFGDSISKISPGSSDLSD